MSAVLSLLLTSLLAFAHDGAHPDGPDEMNERGGIVKETPSYHIEAVPAKKSARIYFFDTKMKPVKVAKVQARARVASSKASLNIVLEPKGDFFEAPYPREPLARYKLIVTATNKGDEVAIFEIDPAAVSTPKK